MTSSKKRCPRIVDNPFGPQPFDVFVIVAEVTEYGSGVLTEFGRRQRRALGKFTQFERAVDDLRTGTPFDVDKCADTLHLFIDGDLFGGRDDAEGDCMRIQDRSPLFTGPL